VLYKSYHTGARGVYYTVDTLLLSLHNIVLVASMLDEFVVKHKTNKKLLLASYLMVNRALVIHENFVPQNEPTTQLINATSCVKIRLELVIPHCKRSQIGNVNTLTQAHLR
jgi:hypothetical protein